MKKLSKKEGIAVAIAVVVVLGLFILGSVFQSTASESNLDSSENEILGEE